MTAEAAVARAAAGERAVELASVPDSAARRPGPARLHRRRKLSLQQRPARATLARMRDEKCFSFHASLSLS